MQNVFAHPGGHMVADPGPATWESLVVVATFGLLVIAGLVLSGRLQLDGAESLVLPLAGLMLLTSVVAAPLRTAVGAWSWWALPVGVGLLAGLLVASITRRDLTSWPALGVTAGVVLVATVMSPLLRL